eukprot:s1508_g28.t2
MSSQQRYAERGAVDPDFVNIEVDVVKEPAELFKGQPVGLPLPNRLGKEDPGLEVDDELKAENNEPSDADLVLSARKVSMLSIFISLVLAILGFSIGLSENVLSVLGFGMESTLDGISSALVMWRFKTPKQRQFRDAEAAAIAKEARDARRERNSAVGIGATFVVSAVVLCGSSGSVLPGYLVTLALLMAESLESSTDAVDANALELVDRASASAAKGELLVILDFDRTLTSSFSAEILEWAASTVTKDNIAGAISSCKTIRLRDGMLDFLQSCQWLCGTESNEGRLKICMNAMDLAVENGASQLDMSELKPRWGHNAVYDEYYTYVWVPFRVKDVLATVYLDAMVYDAVRNHWSEVAAHARMGGAAHVAGNGKGKGKGKSKHFETEIGDFPFDYSWLR